MPGMLGISFTVDDSEVELYAARFPGEMEIAILAGVEEQADLVNEKIRDYEPQYLGILRAETGKFDDSEVEGGEANPDNAVFWVGRLGKEEYGAIVGTNNPYARYVNDGYTIGPNQYAKFDEDGQRVLRRLPPGMYVEGAFMFEKGTEEARGDYQKIMMAKVSNAILNATSTVRANRGRITAYTKHGTYKKITRK